MFDLLEKYKQRQKEKADLEKSKALWPVYQQEEKRLLAFLNEGGALREAYFTKAEKTQQGIYEEASNHIKKKYFQSNKGHLPELLQKFLEDFIKEKIKTSKPMLLCRYAIERLAFPPLTEDTYFVLIEKGIKDVDFLITFFQAETQNITEEAKQIFDPILKYAHTPLPVATSKDRHQKKISAQLYEYLNIRSLTKNLHNAEGLMKDLIQSNLWRMEEFKPAELDRLNDLELIKAYFGGTPLYNLFFVWLPLEIPFNTRFEHTHIVAGSGHGKTQLLQLLIKADLTANITAKWYLTDLAPSQKSKIPFPEIGLCVIDSQGDLIEALLHSWEISQLKEHVILIDPKDIDYPVCLNMFDINLERIKRLDNPAVREGAINALMELYEYIFEDLVEGKLTMYQQNIFRYCAKLLIQIPEATLITFLDLLRDGEKYRPYFAKLEDELDRDFFERDFFSSIYASTKEQIIIRLRNLLSNTTFKRMFSNKQNKVDILEAMNSGKIILINTAKELLQDTGSRILGRFFVAMMLQATYQRASFPEDQRRPFFVYIDEAQDYLNEKIADFFTQARKYKVGLIMAHQYLKQLEHASQHVKASVLANTSIKFVGKVDITDARTMSERINCEPEEIQTLQKKTTGKPLSEDFPFTKYFVYVKDFTKRAVKGRVPLGVVTKNFGMRAEEMEEFLLGNRERYCAKSFNEGVNLQEPESSKKDEGFRLGDFRKL